MSQPAAPAPQPTDSSMLWGFWYPALRSAQLRRRKLASAMLLGVPLAIGRDDQGQAFALRDACPHRGMPLSEGWFDGQAVECSYHGWKFAPRTGQCLEIPSLTADAKLKVDRIFAPRYPAEEQDGYVWVYMSDPPLREAAPEPAPRLPVFSDRYRITHLWAELPCSVDHGIIGLMDPAHGPFVHQAWWWRGRRSIHEKQKQFEPIPMGFRMSPHSPSSNSAPYKLLRLYGEPVTTIDFVLPNMRFEQVRCGNAWFSSRATVTPITPQRCRIDFVAAWNIFRWVPLVMPIFRAFGKRFLRQDQETMIKQAEGLKHDPTLMLIDDADRPARWYFQLKQALADSRRTGQPLRHPLDGPVTLRWRS